LTNINEIKQWVASELHSVGEQGRAIDYRNKLSVSEMVQLKPVGGGCISDAYHVTLPSGQQAFLKTHTQPKLFTAEAEGLRAINQVVPQFAPNVIAEHQHALLLEWLPPTVFTKTDWHSLGEHLAMLHRETHHQFGFKQDNFCGATPQKNNWTQDGLTFFREHRLRFQIDMANRKKLLSSALNQQLDALINQLDSWLPSMPAVLIHGDLWSGNAMSTKQGVKLIDPAVYYGWAEAELAMTCLFGGFDSEFYRAYENASTIEPDWRDRVPLYNLYHLLNHLNLFGASYLSGIQQAVKRFS